MAFLLLVVTVVENKVTHATKFIALRIALAYTESGNQKIVFSFVFIFVTNFWDTVAVSLFSFYLFDAYQSHKPHTGRRSCVRASSLSAADDVVDSSGSHSDDDDDRDDKLDTQTQRRRRDGRNKRRRRDSSPVAVAVARPLVHPTSPSLPPPSVIVPIHFEESEEDLNDLD